MLHLGILTSIGADSIGRQVVAVVADDSGRGDGGDGGDL